MNELKLNKTFLINKLNNKIKHLKFKLIDNFNIKKVNKINYKIDLLNLQIWKLTNN